MPIYLDGQPFRRRHDPSDGYCLLMARASLGAIPNCNDPIRAALAQRIIALAKAGENDPERLCEPALRAASPAFHPDCSVVRRAGET
jgi:hypothetical protein